MDLKQITEKILTRVQEQATFQIMSFEENSFNEVQEQLSQTMQDEMQGLDPLIQKRINEEFFGLGPLSPLLQDNEVSEILVNKYSEVWFERNGALERYHDVFHTRLTYRNFLLRLARDSQIELNLNQPFADGEWLGYRIHMVETPISPLGTVLSLRKHPLSPWTFERFIQQNWCTFEQAQIIRKLIQEKKNLLVIGATGSGKTSVLNACLQELQANERALILEDAQELRIPNAISTKLLTRFDSSECLKNVDLTQLLRQALRMRPDRLVLGEIRGPEAKDLLMALSTGHMGSWGTLHAQNPHQALTRLEMLVQLGAPHWNHNAIRALIWMSLEYIIAVGRNAQGQRILTGLYKITSLEESGFLIEQIL